MKTIKMTVALMLAALLVFSLAACGGKEDPNEVKFVKGTITDATMNTLALQTEDGHILEFSTEGADMSGAAGLVTGTEAEVYYTGTIDGVDTSGVTVIKVVQDAAAAPASTPPADDGAEHSLTGTILESDGATLVVQPNEGGDAITFEIAGADATDANGLVIGDEVTVYYTGALDGSNTTVTRVTQDPNNTPNADAVAQEQPTGGEQSINGMITYCDGATLNLNPAGGGEELSFMISGADSTGCNGLAEGANVTVYFTGEIVGVDTSGVTVTKLTQ